MTSLEVTGYNASREYACVNCVHHTLVVSHTHTLVHKMESSVDYESSVESFDQTLESGNSNTIYYDVVEEGRQPLPVCHFSHYEIRHGLDRQFLCHMPIVIGSLAIFIALGEI